MKNIYENITQKNISRYQHMRSVSRDRLLDCACIDDNKPSLFTLDTSRSDIQHINIETVCSSKFTMGSKIEKAELHFEFLASESIEKFSKTHRRQIQIRPHSTHRKV